MNIGNQVSTLVVEWIEIEISATTDTITFVSTLVVEWIEIPTSKGNVPTQTVSTLVVEWIEIPPTTCHEYDVGSPPSWWSGLKLLWR